MISIGGILVSAWDTTNKFMKDQNEVLELQALSNFFKGQIQGQASATITEEDNSGKIEFLSTASGKTARLVFANGAIKYIPDTEDSSDYFTFLEGAVMDIEVPTGNDSGAGGSLYTMRVKIFETDTGKINTYRFTALSR